MAGAMIHSDLQVQLGRDIMIVLVSGGTVQYVRPLWIRTRKSQMLHMRYSAIELVRQARTSECA